MIPLDEARAHVLGGCEALSTERFALADAAGLVLAETIASRDDVPPFANTAMDGYAVRSDDVRAASDEQPVVLDVVGELPAGTAPHTQVGPGQAIRIMTGAPIPPGADAVVMVERTERVDGDRVAVSVAVGPGNHVRGAGDDVRAGDTVFEPGEVLTPAHLGVLANLGVLDVLAHRRATVAVMSTGDELVDDDAPLGPGQIRDSNRRALLALVAEVGASSLDLGLVPDDPSAIAEALRQGAARADAVVTSGGVSMGDYDYVKAVLDQLGDMRWMQVAIKPAKPLAFGCLDGVPVFGLPGNPVSSMVSFELFARPGIRKMMGHRTLDRARLPATAAVSLDRRPDGKTHFARVRVTRVGDRFEVRPTGGQGSHQLAAMARANGLAVLPDGQGPAPGEPVEVIPLAPWDDAESTT